MMRNVVRMRRLVNGSLLATAAITAACSEPSRSPSYDYQLTLFTDSATHYDISACPGTGYIYCKVAAPDSGRDSLRLHIAASDSASVALGASTTYSFRGIATLRADGSFTVDVNTYYDISSGCQALHLDGTDVNGSASGRWSQQLDCHGASRWGHFTGRR